jgi:predicted RNA-binding Zn-ribbon protein involved in translation (DUF1610 family)
MDGQLIAPVPRPGEDQRYYHRHMGEEIELEVGTSTTTTWGGSENVQTTYRCPSCGQQVERLEPMLR